MLTLPSSPVNGASPARLVEWGRYSARATARKLERFADTKTDWSRPLEEVRDELRETLAIVEDAIAAFDREDEGRLISFGAGQWAGWDSLAFFKEARKSPPSSPSCFTESGVDLLWDLDINRAPLDRASH